jgi:predicted Zn-dependent peptidase
MCNIINCNGITIITSLMKNFSTSALGIFLRVGSRFEKKRVKGIAHFTEHMLFKGTKKFTHKAIKREVEGRGGYLNAFTSQEMTGYYAQFLNGNLRLTLDILTDMVIQPLFDSKEIKKERNVILEEIKMYNDLPHPRSLSLLERELWQNHPLGEDVIGTVATVRGITKKDFRTFQSKYYTPSNIVVCYVGGLDQHKVLDALRVKTKSFAKKKSSQRFSPPPAALKKKKIVVEVKPLDQTHLCVGFRSVSYKSAWRYVVDLLHVIMGANMSSRLFEEIREKRGLCYDISTEARKYRDSGAFIIHAGLDKGNVELALRCILTQIKKVTQKKISLSELGRAKDYYLGQLSMHLERPQGRMFHLADSYIAHGTIHSLPEVVKIVKNIDSKAIRALAEKIFDFNRICISCVGNIDKDLPQHLDQVVRKEGS